jgi:hypothetical protein
VVDVSWLREADDWVDEDVGLTGASGTDGQLSVGTMHWVSGLEGDNAGPAQLVEVESQLRWGVCDDGQYGFYSIGQHAYI